MSIALTTDSVEYSMWGLLMSDNPWQKAEDINLAKIWLIMVLITGVCVVLSIVALSFVDRDRR